MKRSMIRLLALLFICSGLALAQQPSNVTQIGGNRGRDRVTACQAARAIFVSISASDNTRLCKVNATG